MIGERLMVSFLIHSLLPQFEYQMWFFPALIAPERTIFQQ
jgi:hypothetical protein